MDSRPSQRSVDRRKDLIAATLDMIGETSTLDITVGQIARRAGVSPALAHHYFGGKEDLFIATLRSLLEDFRTDVVDRLRHAETPRARLSAIVAASLAPMQFDQATVAAWTIFYVKAQSSVPCARLLAVYVRRLRGNLLYELRRAMPDGTTEAALETAAEAIAAMIDGLYLRQGVRRQPADRVQAIAITERLIDGLLADPPAA